MVAENLTKSQVPSTEPISNDEAAKLMARFKKSYSHIKPACFFLTPDILELFTGIPNFQGINIYNGLTEDGEDVLILVGVTQIEGEFFNVLSYAFIVNGEKNREATTIAAPVLKLYSKKPPCPPLPPGATTCP